MTVQELFTADWILFDTRTSNWYFLINEQYAKTTLNMFHINYENTTDAIEKAVKHYKEDHKVVKIDGKYYLKMDLVEINAFKNMDLLVERIDLVNFKKPTFFIYTEGEE